MTDTITQLPKIVSTDGKSDADRAAELKVKVREVLEATCKVLNGASVDGLDVQFSIVRDNFGRHVVGGINVVKPL